MRAAVLFAACGLVMAQTNDPAYGPLSRAYEAAKAHDYETAVAGFLQAIEAAPQRAAVRKDLAYTYLRIGENELARDQFEQAMLLDPKDDAVAMEYAFLCFESKEQAQARRIFDRVRKTGNPTAEQAFRNIDGPLAAGIERWRNAIALGSNTFDAHYELASMAEQRDDLGLAAEHYEQAWRLAPKRRSVLLDMGRVWKRMGRGDDANAAILAASRGGEARSADAAREFLPERYPYVDEFRRALALDPANGDLRRELAYLLLSVGDKAAAENEFKTLTQTSPGDMLAAAQLGFMLQERGEGAAAAPLLERVIAGPDEDLARRVRNVMHRPQALQPRDPEPAASKAATPEPAAAPAPEPGAKEMGDRSLNAGYIKDAARYLQAAHEADPGDFEVMLKLAWSLNMLGQDAQAFRWFDEARKSPDPKVSAEAQRAWSNLRPGFARTRLTGWIYPMFSTRWHDPFGYGQLKMDVRTGAPVRPYLSLRLVGDLRSSNGGMLASPQQLSESAVIAGVGLATAPWHGVVAWAEAGSAIGYLDGRVRPDYRGGISVSRGLGHDLHGDSPGWFADGSMDAVFVSRFDNDVLFYNQARFGYTFGPRALRAQLYWNGNVTLDDRREQWANFAETGPGLRFGGALLPKSMYLTVNALHGVYLVRATPPLRPNFNDLRAGLWYAFTR